MPLSIFDQYYQINASWEYKDDISGANTQAVAEGQDNLQGDLNVLRTLMRRLKGVTKWYDDPTLTLEGIANKYFIERWFSADFSGVDVIGSSTDAFDAAIKNIPDHNDGQGASDTTGVIVDNTRSHRLPIRDSNTKDPIDDGQGNEVYARLSYNSGVYYLSFYSMVNGTETVYTFGSTTTIDLAYVLVSKRFADLPWDKFLDASFHDVAGYTGSVLDDDVAVDGMQYLLAGLSTQAQVNTKLDKLGSTATGDGASLIAIEDAASYFSGTDIETALNELASQIGGSSSTTYDFTENNVLSDNISVYSALDALDQKWGDLASTANGEGASMVGVEDAADHFTSTNVEGVLNELYQMVQDATVTKVVEVTTAPITAGTNHTLPSGATYTPANGANMEIYVRGQLWNEGSNNDYTESSPTSVTFNRTIPADSPIIYIIRK